MPQQPEHFPSNLILAQEVKLSVPERVQAGDATKLATFRMEAYTGGKMEVGGWIDPVVIDLDGIQGTNKQRPIFKNHDASQIVGHSHRAVVEGGIFVVEGIISGTGPAAAEVLSTSANGFPWQASVGLQARKVRQLKEGETASVNGREVNGPCNIIRKSVYKETSFVPLGADDNTTASVAAEAGRADMPPEQEETIMADGTPSPTPAPAGISAAAAPAGSPMTPDDAIKAARAEHARVAAINRVCASAPEIAEQAIAEGWNPEKAELHALKASEVRKQQDSKVGAPLTNEQRDLHAAALQAALCSGYVPEKALLAKLGEKAMDRGNQLRRLRLKEILAMCCQADGIEAPKPGCSSADMIRATFSSTSFSALLSDSANKIMLAAYGAVPGHSLRVARILNANDFKTHTGVRLTGDLTFDKIENGGPIKHADLSDDSYTYRVHSYGKAIGLTREDLVNDDLGAFLGLGQMFGRGAALTRESLFWTLVLANTGNFFHANNSNYITGATTALAIAGLNEGVQALEEQTDQDGNPIAISGKFLVVPPALKATAQQLYVSTSLTGGSTATLTANTHQGLYEPLSVTHLKAATKAWYLFADPADVAAFGIAFLNGVQEPTIEEVPLSGDYVGRMWRGLLDVGVCQLDPRGAVKSKGEA